MSTSDSASAPQRSLRFGEVLALGVNCVIGSGVFLLPGLVAEGPGGASLLSVAVAGVVACLIALCFAEAGSRFAVSGGAYTYARAAFGEAAGFMVGWVAAVAGLIAWGAIVHAFAVALGTLVPAAAEGAGKTIAIIALVATLGTLNVLGVRQGAGVSTAVTGIKLLALGGFVLIGAFFVDFERFAAPAATVATGDAWGPIGRGALLMFYAFVGFENLVVPAGEMQAPERTLPRAVVAIMATVTVLYLGVQAVAVGTLPGLAGTRNAVAESATTFLGSAGGAAVAIAVVISVLGVNAASALILPRRVSALADQGQLPASLGARHPRFGTPVAAIVLTHVLVCAVALSGSFQELVALAVIARFLQYAPTCAAVLVLRRRAREDGEAGFRLPFGPLIPLLALAASGLLLRAAEPRHLIIGGATVALGLPVLWLMRRSNDPLG